MNRMLKRPCRLVLLMALSATPAAFGQSGTAASVQAAPAPARINLDVLVTDAAGKPVPELEPLDFSLLIDGQPARIAAFRRADGTVGNRVDPPVEVIVVLDAVNMPYQAVTLLRLQLLKFLRSNGGKLPLPVSVGVFSSLGFTINPLPTKDGNALAAQLDTSKGTVR